ncbi:MAG: thiamine ABC transporter substrate-binding protein [Actinobacteria bacterium]|nr:thiamine ABC transporter substrate-binding protein [Actinomycetota bacterium]
MRRLGRMGLGALAGVVALVAAGCGGGSADDGGGAVVLLTHDSFAISKDVKAAFEQESGYTLRLLQQGDAGEVVNRALLTAGDPQGDVLFGTDDSLLSRALDGDLFEPYASSEQGSIDPAFAIEDDRVTPIDHGEVCLNADRAFYAKEGRRPPQGLDDLADPRYRGQLVVQNPATSSPGLAFLLATVARYGEDGWQDYWRRLRANDVLVTDGWQDAYTQQFSGAAGSPGTRPLVVSYATSPAAEVIFAGKPLEESPTLAIEDGCFRQVEYAGILRGARTEDGARALVDFLLSERFQADVPGTMFVYPVRAGTPIPPAFEQHAIRPERPLSLPPSTIAERRDRWIEEWTRIVLR